LYDAAADSHANLDGDVGLADDIGEVDQAEIVAKG
jgi:hypothetical protein